MEFGCHPAMEGAVPADFPIVHCSARVHIVTGVNGDRTGKVVTMPPTLCVGYTVAGAVSCRACSMVQRSLRSLALAVGPPCGQGRVRDIIMRCAGVAGEPSRALNHVVLAEQAQKGLFSLVFQVRRPRSPQGGRGANQVRRVLHKVQLGAHVATQSQ